jgi:hypothetical protein
MSRSPPLLGPACPSSGAPSHTARPSWTPSRGAERSRRAPDGLVPAAWTHTTPWPQSCCSQTWHALYRPTAHRGSVLPVARSAPGHRSPARPRGRPPAAPSVCRSLDTPLDTDQRPVRSGPSSDVTGGVGPRVRSARWPGRSARAASVVWINRPSQAVLPTGEDDSSSSPQKAKNPPAEPRPSPAGPPAQASHASAEGVDGLAEATGRVPHDGESQRYVSASCLILFRWRWWHCW